VAQLVSLGLMRVATLTHEVRQPIRLVNQMASGGSYVAIFTLRITPARDSQVVTFSSEASDPHLESWMESAVERGVSEFVAQRERDGRPVGCFRVALTDIHVHPLDSKEIAFVRAASMAMTQAFEAHETLIDCAEMK
jgi:translation elongation factor EF-G